MNMNSSRRLFQPLGKKRRVFQPLSGRATKQQQTKANQRRQDRAQRAQLRQISQAHFQQTTNQPTRAQHLGVAQTRPYQGPNIIDRDISSSVCWRLRYNLDTQDLFVWWNEGGHGVWRNVPHQTAELVFGGQATATTEGQTPYGRFWPGKHPSVGAAINQYLRDQFPYDNLGDIPARPIAGRANQ
jgi:hypothetical protein